jgi:hypothetical protein
MQDAQAILQLSVVSAFSTATKTYRMLLLDIQLEIDDARSGSRHAELVG